MIIYEAILEEKANGTTARITYDLGEGSKQYQTSFETKAKAENYINTERKNALQIRLERFINNIQWLHDIDIEYRSGKNKSFSLYKCHKLKEGYNPDTKSIQTMYSEIVKAKDDLLNILPHKHHVHFEKLNSDLHEIIIFCDSTLF